MSDDDDDYDVAAVDDDDDRDDDVDYDGDVDIDDDADDDDYCVVIDSYDDADYDGDDDEADACETTDNEDIVNHVIVGFIFLSISCHRRWQHYLKPMKEGYKNQDWTVDEVMMFDDHYDDESSNNAHYDSN